MQRIKDLKSMGHLIILDTPTTFSQIHQRNKALTTAFEIEKKKGQKNTNCSKGWGGEGTQWDVCAEKSECKHRGVANTFKN